MNFLLDSHVFLWRMSDHKSLTSKAVSAINKEGKNIIFVSAVSAWEISIKKALGKLKVPDVLEEALEANRFLHFRLRFNMGFF